MEYLHENLVNQCFAQFASFTRSNFSKQDFTNCCMLLLMTLSTLKVFCTMPGFALTLIKNDSSLFSVC